MKPVAFNAHARQKPAAKDTVVPCTEDGTENVAVPHAPFATQHTTFRVRDNTQEYRDNKAMAATLLLDVLGMAASPICPPQHVAAPAAESEHAW